MLDTTCNLDVKNVTTKSVVLAPYNSSKSEAAEDPYYATVYSQKDKIIKIWNGKLKEIDREYEANNNANMDNGVYNTEDEKSRQPSAAMSAHGSLDLHQGKDPTRASASTRAVTSIKSMP